MLVTDSRQGTETTPLETYLRDDERLYHILSNTQVGVQRTDDRGGGFRPGDSGTAYLGLTDSRIVILVTDPVDRDTEFVTSHQYTNVARAIVERETLTARVVFETQYGFEWSFTARQTDIETVKTFLEAACTDSGPASAGRSVLEQHCTALSAHLVEGEWEEFDDRVPEALEAARQYEREVEGIPGPSTGGQRTVVTDLHCVIRDRHLLEGRERLISARPRPEAGDLELSYRRARTAYDCFERALDCAKRRSLDTENALVGLTMADDIADTNLGRLFATGRERFTDAADRATLQGRIAGFESALERYETIGALVTGDETLSEHARERAKKEAKTTIESLLEARLEAGRQHRQAADWERAAGNEESAQELADDARAELERAHQLATSYPLGDAEEIRDRLDALKAQFG